MLAPVAAIWVKLVPSLERKRLKPFWTVSLLVQDRLIWPELTTLSARLLGAAGAAAGEVAPVVVVLEVFEAAESPVLAEAVM